MAEPVAADPARRRVVVGSPALPAPEPLAEIAFPNTCSAATTSGGAEWRVSCTPHFRRPLLVAKRSASGATLTISPPKGKARTLELALAPEQPLGAPKLIEPRPAPCEPASAATPTVVSFRSNNFYPGHEPRSPFHLLVAGKDALPLVESFKWWQGCSHQLENGIVTITCKDDQHAGKIWTEGASVRFTWRDREEHQGALLLPCDQRPELRAPECFNCNNAYF